MGERFFLHLHAVFITSIRHPWQTAETYKTVSQIYVRTYMYTCTSCDKYPMHGLNVSIKTRKQNAPNTCNVHTIHVFTRLWNIHRMHDLPTTSSVYGVYSVWTNVSQLGDITFCTGNTYYFQGVVWLNEEQCSKII